MIRSICLTLLLLAGCAAAPLAPSTQPSRLEQDVYWLADDAREGRLPGTAGAEAAADFVADRFETLGLAPIDSIGSYKLSFEVASKARISEKTTLAIDGEALRVHHDYRPLAFSGEGAFDAGVAFVGYGAVSAKHDYDDYAGLDVKGRAVLAMRYEPHDAKGNSRFTGDEPSQAAEIVAKARAAHERGAVALLLVNPPLHHADDAALRPFIGGGARMVAAPIPIISITPDAASRLLGGRSLEALQKQIDESGKPASLLLDGKVSGRVDLETQMIRTANIVALLPGVGAHKDEYVVIGAHYDHIGRSNHLTTKPDSVEIHNGADDNASGVAAMLDVARKLRNQRLERGVIFVAFTAEETGLHGSRHFVEHPPVPLEKIVAMINLDMVGRTRNDTLFIGGGGTRPAFEKLLQQADARSPLKFKSIGEGGLGPSDHMSFAIKKVPVLFLFTGQHPQYHHPEDDAWRVNYTGLAEVVDVATYLAERLASMPGEAYVSKYDSASPHGRMLSGSPTTQPVQGVGRAWLGVVPDYGSDQSTGGVRIAGTSPGSPADKAGLREGDVLVAFGTKKIDNLYDLSDLLRKAEPGDEIEVYYLRNDKKEMTRLTLTRRQSMN